MSKMEPGEIVVLKMSNFIVSLHNGHNFLFSLKKNVTDHFGHFFVRPDIFELFVFTEYHHTIIFCPTSSFLTMYGVAHRDILK